MTYEQYPAFAYVGMAVQAALGTPVPPVAFSRWQSISKAEEAIKDEWIRDGLNVDYNTGIKVMQNHGAQFTGELYSDFTTRVLMHILGITDLPSGTAKGGGGSSTIAGGTGTAGSTSLTVASGTGFATGDVVLVGTGGSAGAELLTLGTVAGVTLPIASPTTGLRYAHANAQAVASVVDPFTHTGTATNALPTALTFEHSMAHLGGLTPLDVVRTPDCYFDQLVIESQGGKIATAQYSLVGRLGVPGQSAATVAFETDRPVTLADATFTFSGGLSVVTGDVTQWKVTIKRALDAIMSGGSLAPNQIPGARDIDLEFTVRVPDIKLIRDIWYGGDAATTPTVGLTAVGTLTTKWDVGGSPDHYLQTAWANVLARTASPPYSVDGKAFLVKCTARVALGSGTSVCTVTSQSAAGMNYNAAGA